MEFPKGLFANKPGEKAPDFIKAKLNIDREELIAWLKDQPEKVNIDIRESKDGTKWFAAVNDWKPEKRNQEAAPQGEDLPF